MSVGAQNRNDDDPDEEAAFLAELLEATKPGPCELLRPVLHGIMAMELADMLLSEKEMA